MSTKIPVITDPRLNANMYKYLLVDSSGKYVYSNPDAILTRLQDHVRTIYSSIVLFNNEDIRTANTNNLDRYAIIINNNINKIIEIGIPCIEDKNDPSTKCTTDVCKYMNEIQNILLDLQLTLEIVIIGDIKKKYDFLPFFIQYNFVSRITSNTKNKDIFTNKYLLCNGSTYSPISDKPELQQQFQELLKEKEQIQIQVVESNKTQFIINIFIYVFVCVIIFLVFLFIYKKYYSTKKDIKNVAKLVGGLFHSYSKVNYF